ncbi:rhomboid family intramembrane serine protease [Natronolimnohabitans sp. A-GB9]|uniref:rhomboid family intramembrane serine protease n=1 Tax=Natronolimnohabitans sp. A-GB9 TaxID=3069757 RepID=UPI0027B5C254|nr:rhomboid family intramembrane serine protease [Natronolimnohabitans sp. A-GB9]MDQ2050673.1 rhomboid family intramembrane serine protease [Natronolimnohabitans sp. A-GB9]
MVDRSSRSEFGTRSPSGAGPQSADDGSSSPIVELLVVFVAVYALQWVTALIGVGLMAGLFVLAPPLSTNPWTIVTSVYAHGGLGHLLSNSLALIVFGWPVARATTRLRFHVFFLVTGAIAGVSQIVFTNAAAAMPLVGVAPTEGVIGASGAVFALLGYLIASNRLSASLASFVEVPQWLSALVFLALAVAVTLATAAPGVALLAHFTGFLLGLVAGRVRLLQVGSRSARP